jgi:carbon monoxide dehydrogenase subunit G
MKLDGAIDIAAAPQAVWALIINPVSLAACVPGVRDVRQVDPRTFEGSVSASVGPVDGNFSFTSIIERAVFPGDLGVSVGGVDSVTKSRLEAVIAAGLSGSAEGPTRLTYSAVIKVKGRLAILGEMMLRATASLMIGQVTKCLRSQLERDAPAAPAAPEGAAR